MTAPKSTPKDAQVMAAILKDMGVIEYEPRIINQMLEFTYRYVTNILDDARLFSSHAKKKGIDVEDVRLAIQLQMDKSFTTPPPRELLLEIARQKNSIPLPLIKTSVGPRLPPDRYSLTACNYKLKSTKKPRVQMGITAPRINISSLQTANPALSAVSKVTPAVNLASKTGATLTVVTKATSSPTVAIVSKAPTPTLKPIPTPILKVSEGPPGGVISGSLPPLTVPSLLLANAASTNNQRSSTPTEVTVNRENGNKRKREDTDEEGD